MRVPVPAAVAWLLSCLYVGATGCAGDGGGGMDAGDLGVGGGGSDAGDLAAGPPDLAGEPADAAEAPDLVPPVYHRAPPRDEAAAGWDAVSNTVVLFGGDDGQRIGATRVPSYHNDTWRYDVAAGAWSAPAARGPSERGRAAFAVDTAARRLIVTQGRYRPQAAGADPNTPYTLLDDTWAYDFAGSTWSRLGTSGDPPPRAGASAVYDAPRDRLVVFGGDTGTAFDPGGDPAGATPGNETWQLVGGKTWSRVATQGGPPSPRYLAGAALDGKRQRLVLYGGCCDAMGKPFSDTWALDLATNTWSQLAGPKAGPSSRYGHGAAWDAGNDRMVIFGGHDDTMLGPTNDVWVVDADGGWVHLNPGDSLENTVLGCGGDPAGRAWDYVLPIFGSPERRERAVMVSTGDGILIAGGVGDCAQLDDTFTLRLGNFTREIPPLQGESCLRRGEQCPCLCR